MKVLVVDDDPVSPVLAATLADTLGHAVDTATTGLAARDRLSEGRGEDDLVLDPAPVQRMHQLGRQVGRHLAEQIVQTWLRQSEQALAAIERAVHDGDAATVRTVAHTLKGSSATVGAAALAAVCSDLETHRSWADCPGLVHRAARLLPMTHDALQSLVLEASTGV